MVHYFVTFRVSQSDAMLVLELALKELTASTLVYQCLRLHVRSTDLLLEKHV